MKKLLTLLLALVLTSQLVTPALAEIQDTAAPTAELEEPTQMPVTEPPVPATLAPTEPATETPTTEATEAPETIPAETTPATEPPAATEVPEVTDPTEETEATEPTEATDATDPTDPTDPTEETTETVLELLAEEDILAQGTCGAEGDGSNVTWVLTTDGTMILSGTGAVAAYDSRKDTPWGDYNYQILRVEVQKGITSVSGFCSCYELQEVSLPEGLISIGKLTFMDCQKLQEDQAPQVSENAGRGYVCLLLRLDGNRVSRGSGDDRGWGSVSLPFSYQRGHSRQCNRDGRQTVLGRLGSEDGRDQGECAPSE